jgi:hypothetical protein
MITSSATGLPTGPSAHNSSLCWDLSTCRFPVGEIGSYFLLGPPQWLDDWLCKGRGKRQPSPVGGEGVQQLLGTGQTRATGPWSSGPGTRGGSGNVAV